MAISSEPFTTLNLAGLPAPEVVEQVDFAELRTAMIADAAQLVPGFNTASPADPVIKLIEYFAYRELLLRTQFNERAQWLLLAFAQGTNLDHLGALYGLKRQVVQVADAQQGIPEIIEADADFRERIARAPETFSPAGPSSAYVNLAREADPLVAFASCTSPSPGNVLVTVQSRDGDGSASPALVQTVLTYLSDETRRPLTDNLVVQSAATVRFRISAQVRTFAGPDPALAIAAGRDRLESWLTENQQLGRDITLDGVLSQLRVEGVSRVTLTDWADIECGPTEVAFCEAIELDHLGIGE